MSGRLSSQQSILPFRSLFTSPIMMLTLSISATVAIGWAGLALGHDNARPREDARPIADFPNVGSFKVLAVDLHTHSVFSDGHVWPSIRAEEAARDIIDAIAITEHLEWQPHIADIPNTDRNRAYEETVRSAKALDLLVIPGVEITRVDEAGHINAVFIKDANPLVKASGIKDYLPDHLFNTRAEAESVARAQSEAFASAHKVERDGETRWAPFSSRELYMTLVNFGVAAERDPREVLDAAAAQGAFSFWNHPLFEKPDWKLPKFHRAAIKDNALQGIEIANGDHYYPNAHRLALKHNLALIGTSDVHQLIAWDYDREKNQHRPVTLVMAPERSAQAIKDALFARRTIVWWNHTLIGRKAQLQPLLEASITLEKVSLSSSGRTQLWLRNNTGAEFRVAHTDGPATTRAAGQFPLRPNSITQVDVASDERSGTLTLAVLNALLAPGESATIEIAFEKPAK